MKQSNRSQQLYLVNVSVVIMLLVLVGILAVVLPKPTVSEVEKRELAAKPQWSLRSWFSGEYAEQYDAYYADTFPQREQLVSLASKLEQMQGVHPDDVRIHPAGGNAQQSQQLPQPEPEAEQEPQQELAEEPQSPTVDYDAYSDPNAPGNGLSEQGTAGEQVGSLFLYRNMGMQIFGSSQTLSEEYARVISSYAQQLNGVQVYNLIAPTSIEFYLPEKYQGIASSERENIDFVAQQMSDKVISVDAYSQIEKNREDYLYFRTDHHWTARGAYEAYIAFCKSAGLTPVSLEEMEHQQIDGFLGTFYSQTHDSQLAQTPGFVEYFVPPVQTTTTRYQTGAPFTPIDSSIFASYATGGQNTYSVFLHGDFPLTHIQTDNRTGRKILLVKESYGNAFAPFLACNFDEVYIVDQRYFELGLVDFVKEHGITDLLFLNNIFAVNTDVRIRELSRIQNQRYQPISQQPVQQPTQQTQEIEKEAEKNGVRCSVDTRAEKIGYKIRESRLEKVPYMLVVGQKEEEEQIEEMSNQSKEQAEKQENETPSKPSKTEDPPRRLGHRE